eukprot:m.127604 g.127604  ORF g.127604 m.127604 type:complete len:368 (-) comp13014_c0_seq1:1631-2734(-)
MEQQPMQQQQPVQQQQQPVPTQQAQEQLEIVFRNQISYYFSPWNLAQDNFLVKMMTPDLWISANNVLVFQKVEKTLKEIATLFSTDLGTLKGSHHEYIAALLQMIHNINITYSQDGVLMLQPKCHAQLLLPNVLVWKSNKVENNPYPTKQNWVVDDFVIVEVDADLSDEDVRENLKGVHNSFFKRSFVLENSKSSTKEPFQPPTPSYPAISPFNPSFGTSFQFPQAQQQLQGAPQFTYPPMQMPMSPSTTASNPQLNSLPFGGDRMKDNNSNAQMFMQSPQVAGMQPYMQQPLVYSQNMMGIPQQQQQQQQGVLHPLLHPGIHPQPHLHLVNQGVLHTANSVADEALLSHLSLPLFLSTTMMMMVVI